MAQPWSRPQLKFQTKVLIPVVTVMALFLMGTMWLVNNRIEEQLQNETTALLFTAQAQFTNALNTYSENLVRQYRTIPDHPDFFYIAALFQNPSDDKNIAVATMREKLIEILDKQGRENSVLMFAGASGQLLAAANRYAGLDTNQFFARCAPFIKAVTDSREAEVHIIQASNSLFLVVMAPSFQATGGEFLGTLIFGVDMDSTVARQLKSPDSQIAFIANDQVVASTLEKEELNDALLQDFKALTVASTNNNDMPATQLPLQGEHYGERPGAFHIPSGQGKADYLLLVSYEKPLQTLRDERRYLLLCSLLGILLSSTIVWA